MDVEYKKEIYTKEKKSVTWKRQIKRQSEISFFLFVFLCHLNHIVERKEEKKEERSIKIKIVIIIR